MAITFTDRVSTYPNRYKLTDAEGNEQYVTLERADEPTVLGTPLNAATFNSMGLSMDLLWDNPDESTSSSTSFRSQTVALDLSKYSFVFVVTGLASSNSVKECHVIPVNGNKFLMRSYGAVYCYRTATATTSGIKFDSAYYVTAYGINSDGTGKGDHIQDDTELMPQFIYGIR